MSLQPKSYEDALARKQALDARRRANPSKRMATRSPLKSHKPMSRGTKRMKSRGKPDPNSVRGLENTLDDLVRKVLHRDQKVCFTDGRPGTEDDPLEVSHLFGRAMRPTRFDVFPGGNNCLMHKSCNNRHNDDKSIYRNAFIKRYGQESYDELERRAHQRGATFDYIQLHQMIEQRQVMLK